MYLQVQKQNLINSYLLRYGILLFVQNCDDTVTVLQGIDESIM